MDKSISFGQLNRKLYLFPLVIINSIINSRLIRSIASGIGEINENLSNSLIYLILFFMFISESLAYILYYIEKKLSSSNKSTKTENLSINQNSIEPVKDILNSTKQNPKFLILCILSSMLDLTGELIDELKNPGEKYETLSTYRRMFLMISITIASIFILSFDFSRHHFLGLSLIGIGVFIYVLYDIIYKITKGSWYLVAINILIIQICQTGNLTIRKYLMQFQYFSPFLIVSFEGFVGLILSPIIFLILHACGEININPFLVLVTIFKKWSLSLMFITLIITLFSFNALVAALINIFTPVHKGMNDIFIAFSKWILFDLILGNSIHESNIIFYLIMFIFGFLGGSIFLEIITIGFFELDKFTKKRIIEREKYFASNYQVLNEENRDREDGNKD